jgi:hypothetical protein
MDHYIKKTIREFINLFETEIFLSWSRVKRNEINEQGKEKY